MDAGRLGHDLRAALTRQTISPNVRTMDAWAAYVSEVARDCGWLTVAAEDSSFFLTNGVTIIFVVLAVGGKRLSQEQALWTTALLNTEKVECHVWHPDELEHLPDILRRRSR